MFKVLQTISDKISDSLRPQTSLMSFFAAEYKSDAKHAYEYFLSTGELTYYNCN